MFASVRYICYASLENFTTQRERERDRQSHVNLASRKHFIRWPGNRIFNYCTLAVSTLGSLYSHLLRNTHSGAFNSFNNSLEFINLDRSFRLRNKVVTELSSLWRFYNLQKAGVFGYHTVFGDTVLPAII